MDGYNVIRRDADLRGQEALSLETGRTALLAAIAVAARRTGDDFTVVFDGARRAAAPPAPGQVQVVFSRPPETADDVLRALAVRGGAGTVVASSDRAVRDAARRAGTPAIHLTSRGGIGYKKMVSDHLFIVSRQQLDLYRYLSREFSTEVDVQVILDRRYGERRIHDERRSATRGDRRATDRRGPSENGTQINTLGYAFVRLATVR